MSALGSVGILFILFLTAIATATLSIWIVGKLGLGLRVSGFLPALLAALAIGLLIFVIDMFFALLGASPDSGLASMIVDIIAAGIVLYLASRIGKGIQVNGFLGALVAAALIAGLNWLFGRIIIP